VQPVAEPFRLQLSSTPTILDTSRARAQTISAVWRDVRHLLPGLARFSLI
jgi:hypothetical protein